MSRRSKGPRLWLRNAQYGRDGKLTHVAVWIIKDGKYRESTGCGANDRRRAEAALASYIGRKHLADAEAGLRHSLKSPSPTSQPCTGATLRRGIPGRERRPSGSRRCWVFLEKRCFPRSMGRSAAHM